MTPLAELPTASSAVSPSPVGYAQIRFVGAVSTKGPDGAYGPVEAPIVFSGAVPALLAAAELEEEATSSYVLQDSPFGV